MTEIENNILQALLELEQAVAAMSAARPKPDLKALFARIDGLAEQLPPQTDPSLLHYLHKKSYEKARLFLQGREDENRAGQCRHIG